MATLLLTRSTPQLGAVTLLPSGGVSLQLNQLSGHGPSAVYASPGLGHWQPIFTDAPTAGSLEFIDPSATKSPARFYQAVEQ